MIENVLDTFKSQEGHSLWCHMVRMSNLKHLSLSSINGHVAIGDMYYTKLGIYFHKKNHNHFENSIFKTGFFVAIQIDTNIYAILGIIQMGLNMISFPIVIIAHISSERGCYEVHQTQPDVLSLLSYLLSICHHL